MTRIASLARCSRFLGVLCLLVPLALAGCTSKRGTVSGVVTYKGQPLGNGTVSFVSADGKGTTGAIQPDGHYQVNDAPLGPVTISVVTVPPPPDASAPKGWGGLGKVTDPNLVGGGAAGSAGKYVKIPDKYKDAKSSGLTYDVKGGKQKFDIELQ